MEQFWITLLKIFVFLPFILLLIYLSLKYGNSKLQHLQNGRFIKVIERVSLTKESSLVVAKFGEKAYVLASSSTGTTILYELSNEEMIMIQERGLIESSMNIKAIYNKFFQKKEEKNE